MTQNLNKKEGVVTIGADGNYSDTDKIFVSVLFKTSFDRLDQGFQNLKLEDQPSNDLHLVIQYKQKQTHIWNDIPA